MRNYLNLMYNLVILIVLFRLHWTRNIMTRPSIVDVLPTPGHWPLLFTTPQNCFLCRHQHKTSQWPGYGAVSSWHRAYFRRSFFWPARKSFPGSFLQTSSLFGKTSRRRLNFSGRQQLNGTHSSSSSKFNCNQISVFGHVPVIFDQPALCPAVPHFS